MTEGAPDIKSGVGGRDAAQHPTMPKEVRPKCKLGTWKVGREGWLVQGLKE